MTAPVRTTGWASCCTSIRTPVRLPSTLSITISQLAPGATADGIALGVEIAQRVKAIAGRPTLFGASLTGPYGQVAWFVLADSIDEIQAGNEAIGADADWVTMMDDRASKAYVGAVSQRFIMRRMA